MQLKSVVLCEKDNYYSCKNMSEILEALGIKTKVHQEDNDNWLSNMADADFLVVIITNAVSCTNFLLQMGYAEGKHKPIFIVQPEGYIEPTDYSTFINQYLVMEVNDPAIKYLVPQLRAFLSGLKNNFRVEIVSRDLRDALLGYNYKDTNTRLFQTCRTGRRK